ncbi:unnamed protein product [Parnassius mnemosyne]|uniref:DDE Tnp4 domain-containing protein n=1 Tax=Parnassius mnemosyne TaxID=213953 RepID=A0AAV1L9Z0_9NEOP
MSEEIYLNLLSLVSPLIRRKDTVMRNAISPHERLTATLRFLATGRSYEDLKFSTIISPQALSSIIPDTCEALFKVLCPDFLKFPNTEQDWKNIAEKFEKRWNFPHCLGAIDGKHVSIALPPGCGSEFYNYKNRHSMVLMAIVDAQYKFILCDFGTNGRISDGGVLRNTVFFEKLQDSKLNIPAAELVNNSNRSLPYVFVADDAFPLRTDMIKPFRQADLNTYEKKIYNYRVSRARRIVENAFGILASRFRIFHTEINIEPKNIDSVVLACCALHNYLTETNQANYSPPEILDREFFDNGTIIQGVTSADSDMIDLDRRHQGNITNAAKKTREDFMKYFVNEEQVPWQDNFIR